MTPFLGHCHASAGADRVRLVAAAHCADREEFEALVGAALAAQGYRLDWAEDVLPAGDWGARHAAAGAIDLARSVHAGRRVALGPMTARLAKGEAAPDQNWVQFQVFTPIEPLDAQFGVQPKKSVPDALREAIFGQPAPTTAEREACGDAPLATYAVLDAAKMPNVLTSLLEGSGLRYQSLFQGAAQEDLGEHAPYLVELKADDDFTRRLFTGPNGVGGLWEKELGVLLRARLGFDDLRKQLRRLTRVQDRHKKWFYFRFWEGRFLPDYFAQLTPLPDRAAHFLCSATGAHIGWIIADPRAAKVTVIQGNPRLTAAHATHPFVLGDLELAIFAQIRLSEFHTKLVAHLGSTDPAFAAVPVAQQHKWVQDVTRAAQRSGITIEKYVADYAQALLVGGAAVFQDRRVNTMLESNAHQADKAGFLLEAAQTLNAESERANE
ncbi:MAG TPA: DUF4123 domain-containing protein [Gemmobacter sp.]|nr:DUF4123 domain-containing protein [Gemmobacter sp.]